LPLRPALRQRSSSRRKGYWNRRRRSGFPPALGEHNVEVEFRIAEGYYLHRDRFSFATESGKALAEVEIYRNRASGGDSWVACEALIF
jgi:hypothetical protein